MRFCCLCVIRHAVLLNKTILKNPSKIKKYFLTLRLQIRKTGAMNKILLNQLGIILLMNVKGGVKCLYSFKYQESRALLFATCK